MRFALLQTCFVLLVLAGVFALSVLCVGIALVLVMVLRFLLTGRKPAVVTTFARFNQAAQQFRPGGSSATRQDSADIVDVEAHEVRAVLNAPAPPARAGADNFPPGRPKES